MTCPNCGSCRVRRSRRTTAEKLFLVMLATRPFRCEDCIGRFFSWVWRSPAPNAADTDVNSLVYNSPTAALHSGVSRSHKKHRKVKVPWPVRASLHGLIASWLGKPLLHQAQVASNAINTSSSPRVMPEPRRESLPEILGVILEMKHQAS